MRRLALVTLMIVSGAVVVDACGDKFLLVGRGLAFGRAYASIYPGSIVIYGEPATKAQLKKLHETVRKAGHRATLVNTPTDLSARLTLNGTDIIIADVTLKADLERATAALTTKPSILYLQSEADKTAAPPPDAETVKRGEKSSRFLIVLDDMMKARHQAGVRVKRG